MLLLLGSGLKTITLGKSLLVSGKPFLIYTPSLYWGCEYKNIFGESAVYLFDFSSGACDQAFKFFADGILNNLVIQDRILGKFKRIEASEIIRKYASDIEYLILKKGIKIVCGEQAYAFERCAGHVAKIHEVEMRLIEGVKYPEFEGSERIASFNVNRSRVIATRKNENYRQELHDFSLARQKISNSYIGTAYIKVNVYEWSLKSGISKIWFHIWRRIKYGRDHTQRPIFELVLDRILSALGIRLEKFFVCSSLTMSKPFVFIPLHLPEDEAIETLGREFRDQAKMAVDVADALGSDYMVCVKRHPHNKKRFWQVDWVKLYRHPNIMLASQDLETSTLMKHAAFTLTVCGSASLEAAMLGFKSGTLVPLFFNNILSAGTVQINDDLRKQIQQPVKSENEFDRYLEYVFENSFPGIAGVIGLRSEAQSQQNIEKLGIFFGRALP